MCVCVRRMPCSEKASVKCRPKQGRVLAVKCSMSPRSVVSSRLLPRHPYRCASIGLFSQTPRPTSHGPRACAPTAAHGRAGIGRPQARPSTESVLHRNAPILMVGRPSNIEAQDSGGLARLLFSLRSGRSAPPTAPQRAAAPRPMPAPGRAATPPPLRQPPPAVGRGAPSLPQATPVTAA